MLIISAITTQAAGCADAEQVHMQSWPVASLACAARDWQLSMSGLGARGPHAIGKATKWCVLVPISGFVSCRLDLDQINRTDKV